MLRITPSPLIKGERERNLKVYWGDLSASVTLQLSSLFSLIQSGLDLSISFEVTLNKAEG